MMIHFKDYWNQKGIKTNGIGLALTLLNNKNESKLKPDTKETQFRSLDIKASPFQTVVSTHNYFSG